MGQPPSLEASDPRQVHRLPFGEALAIGVAFGSAHKCRNGHVRTAHNTWRAKSGDFRCKDCRRAHKPLKTRRCRGCPAMFAGSRGKYCSACVALRHMDEMEHAPKPIRTRTCTDCQETKPLSHFERDVYAKDRKGVQQYSDRCADCRSEDDDDEDDEFHALADSPYEKARRQIESIFGLPARAWINVRGHVLNDLHYLRMLAIQHAEARRTGAPLTNPGRDTKSRHLWHRLVADRLTVRTRRASALPFRTRIA